MIVNADANVYAKTRNHRETLQQHKRNNLLKIKRILMPKYKLSAGDQVFTFSLSGGGAVPILARSLTPLPVN